MANRWEDEILACKRGDQILPYKCGDQALAYKWGEQITMTPLLMGWVMPTKHLKLSGLRFQLRRPRTSVKQLTSSQLLWLQRKAKNPRYPSSP
jgi:hypothetical protein